VGTGDESLVASRIRDPQGDDVVARRDTSGVDQDVIGVPLDTRVEIGVRT
jgi:hypothetical protein